MMELDDLVLSVRRGDSRAWNELGRRLIDDLDRYFRRWVGELRAEDLTQNTLMIVHRNLARFEVRADEPFHRWVRRIARIQVQEEFRQQGRRERAEQQFGGVEPMLSKNLSTRLDHAERMAVVEHELARLNSRYRRVIEHDLVEQDDVAFAASEHIKEGSVRTRRRRARKLLRDRVRARCN